MLTRDQHVRDYPTSSSRRLMTSCAGDRRERGAGGCGGGFVSECGVHAVGWVACCIGVRCDREGAGAGVVWAGRCRHFEFVLNRRHTIQIQATQFDQRKHHE